MSEQRRLWIIDVTGRAKPVVNISKYIEVRTWNKTVHYPRNTPIFITGDIKHDGTLHPFIRVNI